MLGDNTANLKFINLKQKAGAQEAETPRFWLNEKVNGAWVATKNYGFIEGSLTKAEIIEKEIKGVKSKFFILEMASGDERYKVTMSHGSLTYSIINSIASNCNSLETYKISVSKKQSKDGKYWNGQGYVNVGGSNEMQKWSIDPQSDLVPKKVAVMVGGTQFMQNGKPVWDDTAVKAFWENVFQTKIVAHLGGSSARPAVSTGTANTGSGAPVINAGESKPDDFEDLPF